MMWSVRSHNFSVCGVLYCNAVEVGAGRFKVARAGWVDVRNVMSYEIDK